MEHSLRAIRELKLGVEVDQMVGNKRNYLEPRFNNVRMKRLAFEKILPASEFDQVAAYDSVV